MRNAIRRSVLSRALKRQLGFLATLDVISFPVCRITHILPVPFENPAISFRKTSALEVFSVH